MWTKHRYAQLGEGDDECSPEEESFCTRLTHCTSSLRLNGPVAICLLGLSAVLNLGLLWRELQSSTRLLEERHGLVPSVPLKLVTFVNQSELFPPFDMRMSYEEQLAQIEEAWRPVLIEGGGMVQIPPEQQADLGPPMTLHTAKDRVEDNMYAISAFHSIHCVFHVYRDWLKLAHGRPANETPHGHMPGPTHGDHAAMHVSHCLDYILQAIKCAGDSTLEHGNPEIGTGLGTFGLGAVHVCKDWDAFVRYPTADNELAQSRSRLATPAEQEQLARFRQSGGA